jgi:serine/threonine-protein kinase
MGTSQESDPRVGQLLHGRYRVARKMGEGGMGAVYQAEHVLIGRRVAIKTLHPQFATNPELVERFHREANSAASIGNEHIIEVTDFGFFDDDGAPYLVMEYLEGRELGDLLDNEGALPLARLTHIMLQVCDALSAAHSRGIVHRDIKPENIFLVRRGGDADFVKVLDFGISKVSGPDDELRGSLTRTGVALGTPYYMPPEQAQGVRDIDQRADVYALGIILYRALAGRLPFDAETYAALMVKILTERPPLPRSFRADIPPELEQIALKAMAKNRDERFQSVEELAQALLPFSGIEGAPQMLRSFQPPMVVNTTPFTQSDKPNSLPSSSGSTRPCARSCSTCCQMASNSRSTMLSGTSNSCASDSWSRISRFMRMRERPS